MLAELVSGTLINNRYQIRNILGQGGFGRTYLAADTHRFGDFCVLKEFVPVSGAEHILRKSRELCEREAKVLYQIHHPQIPKFLAWLNEQDRLFLVQEYIDGKNYSQLLWERQQQGRAFSEAEVIQWLSDLLPVLAHIHRLNIIHRDISPENVMLPHGQSKPVLIDFGLVKEAVTQIWSAYVEGSQHPQGSVVGKFGYAPPEQIRMGQCFPCSDIYALSVTALVLLTGRKPRLLIDRGSLEWRWHPYVNVSDRLAQILDKMLAEKPKERYQSAQEVLAELQPLTESAESQSSKPVEIQIDVAKKNRQVAEILETETFKRLEQRANKLRKRTRTPPQPQSETQTPQRSTPSLEEIFSPSAYPSKVASQLHSQAETAAVLNPAFLERCRQELADCIGPIASLILEDTLVQHPNLEPQQLVEALAAEIPNPQRAKDFRNRIEIALKSQSAANPAEVAPQLHSQAETAAALNPAFLKRCRQELADCIGPIASLILEDTLAQHPNLEPQQLIKALAAEIPHPKRAEEFKQRFR